MSSLTIRDLDEATDLRLREHAARNGSTPEEEARAILAKAYRELSGLRAALSESKRDPEITTLYDLRMRMLEIAGEGFDMAPYLPTRAPGRESPFMGEE